MLLLTVIEIKFRIYFNMGETRSSIMRYLTLNDLDLLNISVEVVYPYSLPCEAIENK
jgi:hypothetical protein